MQEPVLVGDWRVEPRLNRLQRGDEEASVEPRSMEVLVALITAGGEVSSKTEILEAVWGEQVVTEEALTHAIWDLRRSLGDDARRPRYIQTIPKRGYRLIADVRPITAEPSGEEPGSISGSDRKPPARKPRSWRQWGLGLAAVALGALLTLFLAGGGGDDPSCRLMLRVTPVPADGELVDLAVRVDHELRQLLLPIQSLSIVSRGTSARLGRAALAEVAATTRATYVIDIELRASEPGTSACQAHLELVRVSEDQALWRGDVDLCDPSTDRLELSSLAWVLVQALASHAPEFEDDLPALQDYLAFLGPKDFLASQPRRMPSEAQSAMSLALDKSRVEDYEKDRLWAALELFEYAVGRDETHCLAWTSIAKIHTVLSFNGHADSTSLQAAQSAIGKARICGAEPLELGKAEAYLAYYGRRDYERAFEVLRRVTDDTSRDPEVLSLLAYLERRSGRLEKAVELLERVLEIDPENHAVAGLVGETYRALRRFDEAASYYDLALRIDPSKATLRGEAALNRFAQTGSAREALDLLAAHPSRQDQKLFYYRVPLLLLDRKAQQAKDVAATMLGTDDPIVYFQVSWHIAQAHRLLGAEEEARLLVNELRQYMEEQVERNPGFDFFHGYLALTQAFLGRESEARERVAIARELSEKDRFSGPRIREIEARVLAMVGEEAASSRILSRLLDMSYQHCLTRHDLRADPFWDPWRDAPGFPTQL